MRLCWNVKNFNQLYLFQNIDSFPFLPNTLFELNTIENWIGETYIISNCAVQEFSLNTRIYMLLFTVCFLLCCSTRVGSVDIIQFSFSIVVTRLLWEHQIFFKDLLVEWCGCGFFSYELFYWIYGFILNSNSEIINTKQTIYTLFLSMMIITEQMDGRQSQPV